MNELLQKLRKSQDQIDIMYLIGITATWLTGRDPAARRRLPEPDIVATRCEYSQSLPAFALDL
ncbi:hypothetical protein ACQ7HM_18060 [Williamsia sp. MIQD14]|uniref:hypothetical protein n=1 Tax=Williamsia sp. MIQD14 TaxID=3425703 RepID=UPI003DA0FE02